MWEFGIGCLFTWSQIHGKGLQDWCSLNLFTIIRAIHKSYTMFLKLNAICLHKYSYDEVDYSLNYWHLTSCIFWFPEDSETSLRNVLAFRTRCFWIKNTIEFDIAFNINNTLLSITNQPGLFQLIKNATVKGVVDRMKIKTILIQRINVVPNLFCCFWFSWAPSSFLDKVVQIMAL